MPPIKKTLAVRKPTKSIEVLKSSTKDIWIITPAEKPKVSPINLRLGLLTNNPKMAPMVVAIPARKDKKKLYRAGVDLIINFDKSNNSVFLIILISSLSSLYAQIHRN